MSDNQSGKEGGERSFYRVKTFREVPKGAVLMSSKEILALIHTKIRRYPNVKEIWPLKYDRYISGGFATLTSLGISNHYRKMFMLQNFGRGPTFASCLMAGLVTSTAHHDLIKEKILIGYHDCPMCLSLRGGAIQVLGAVGYSMILVPTMCILVARSYYTYPVPSFKETPLVYKMIKSTFPLGRILTVYLIGNFLMGSVLAEKELIVYEKIFGQKFDPKLEKGEFYTDLKS